MKRLWTYGPLASRVLRSESLVLLLSAIYFLLLWPFTPGLASPANLENVLSSLLPLLVLAIGQTFVLISGGIDLSITSIVALASVTGASVMNADTGWLRGSPMAVPAGVLSMVVVGLLLGGANGLAVTWLRMPAFIVTLTSMMFFSGFAIWSTQSRNIGNLPTFFNALGARTVVTLGITIMLGGVAHAVLTRGLLGRWLYAVGHNSRTARISGVPVEGVTLSAYVVSGLCAAVASIFYTGRLETGSPVLGQRILLDVIGATVIGGASLYGGRGHVVGTLFGALFLTILDNSLNLLNLSYFTIMMAKGAVILLAAIVDAFRVRALSRTER